MVAEDLMKNIAEHHPLVLSAPTTIARIEVIMEKAMYKFVFFFILIGAAALIFKHFERIHYSQTVISRVTLKTNCDMALNAFAIKNVTSGEIRQFQHGEAFIKGTLADELMIVLSEEFEQVSFEKHQRYGISSDHLG